MAYVRVNYPEFSDIKVASFVGFDIRKISDDIAVFFTDVANKNFRLIDIITIGTAQTHNPVESTEGAWPQDLFQATTIVYTE